MEQNQNQCQSQSANRCGGSSNKCIACSVTNCAHHDGCENYCTLPKIQVGTHEACPTKADCTDCQSFQMKK